MRFLALGDSYTIGDCVAETEQWPVQLVNRLQEQGIPISPPEIIAASGWTTNDLAEGIKAVPPQRLYDFVSLLIGVNNQYQGRSREEYRQQFAELLQQAVTLARNDPACVIVLSIPDWSVTPFAAGLHTAVITAEIDAFNAINRAETEKAGAHYVDVTAVSRQAAADPTLIAEDGLHPSGKMYTAWAALALPVVLEEVIRNR